MNVNEVSNYLAYHQLKNPDLPPSSTHSTRSRVGKFQKNTHISFTQILKFTFKFERDGFSNSVHSIQR